MPANSKEYQKAYRAKHRDTRKVVSVSVSASEHQEMVSYATQQGLSLSMLLREATLQQCRKSQLSSREVQTELKELRFLISNIANNLNQMAHHSNRLRHVVDENGALEQLAELDGLVRHFVSERMQRP